MSVSFPVGETATEMVDVVLVGGPATLPAELREQRVNRGLVAIKIPHLGGYEHFYPDDTEPSDAPLVYRWSWRTRVAE